MDAGWHRFRAEPRWIEPFIWESGLHFCQYVSGIGQDDPTLRRSMTKMRRVYLQRMLVIGGVDLTKDEPQQIQFVGDNHKS